MQVYCITYIRDKDQMRTLYGANQGRNHWDNAADPAAALEGFKKGGIEKVLSAEEIKTLEVRSGEAYPHGDLKSIYFLPTFSGMKPGALLWSKQYKDHVHCNNCGTAFILVYNPKTKTDAPSCNGHFIEVCPWCREDSRPWHDGRGV